MLGGGALTPDEQKTISESGIADSIVSVPLASDGLLAEAYAHARLFIYPSFSEGFGFPPLEAMISGCPVLASNATAIPEVCADAPFYFDPREQDSFNRELLRAVNDEEARRRAIERGREVAAHYSWAKCGQETLSLYRECQ